MHVIFSQGVGIRRNLRRISTTPQPVVTLDLLRRKTGMSAVWSLMKLLPVFMVPVLETRVWDDVVATVKNLLAVGEDGGVMVPCAIAE
jgi:hypothetical protein